jgi:hypothetical protein
MIHKPLVPARVRPSRKPFMIARGAKLKAPRLSRARTYRFCFHSGWLFADSPETRRYSPSEELKIAEIQGMGGQPWITNRHGRNPGQDLGSISGDLQLNSIFHCNSSVGFWPFHAGRNCSCHRYQSNSVQSSWTPKASLGCVSQSTSGS